MGEKPVLPDGVGHYLNKNSAASVCFDLFRALAALAVLLHHIRPSFFVPYAQVDHKNAVIQLFYLFSQKGYQSVMVFFVLSGFFISSSVLGSVSKPNWSWRTYLNHRVTRLGAVLLPALLLTYLWNEISLLVFKGQALVGHMGWSVFWMNLLFLQGIGPFPSIMFGENDALWSLSIEFWFYILFPCILLAFVSKSRRAKTIYGCIALGLGLFLGKQVLPLFAIWLLGTAVLLIPDFKAPRKLVTRLMLFVAPLLLFLGVFLLSGRSKGFFVNFEVGASFAALLYVVRVLFNQRSRTPVRWNGFILKAAGFSYTLYLTHFPINNLLVSYIQDKKLQPGIGSILLFAVIVFVTVAYAWLVSLITEEQTAKLRQTFAKGERLLHSFWKKQIRGRIKAAE